MSFPSIDNISSNFKLLPFLLLKEHDLTQIYLLNLKGQFQLIASVKWIGIITCCIYKFPYVIAINNSNLLQIAYVELAGYYEIVQTFSLNQNLNTSSNLSLVNIYTFLNYDSYLKMNNNLNKVKIKIKSEINNMNELWFEKEMDIFVVSDRQIWKLSPISIENQVKQLNFCENYKISSTLVKCLDNNNSTKASLIYSTNRLYGMKLFSKQKFKEAMEIFLEINIEPIEVIRLYPFVVDFLELEMRKENEFVDENDCYLSGKEFDKSLEAFIYYLTQVNKLKFLLLLSR